MKKWMILLVLVLPVASFAADGFDLIRSLQGQWEGRMANGQAVTLTYTPISSGTAVMEEMRFQDGTTMTSVFHRNGESVMMTHYCAGNNQPRLKSAGISDSAISFEYLDATNVSEKNPEYLSAVSLKLLDSNHLEQQSSFTGGKMKPLTVLYVRKK